MYIFGQTKSRLFYVLADASDISYVQGSGAIVLDDSTIINMSCVASITKGRTIFVKASEYSGKIPIEGGIVITKLLLNAYNRNNGLVNSGRTIKIAARGNNVLALTTTKPTNCNETLTYSSENYDLILMI